MLSRPTLLVALQTFRESVKGVRFFCPKSRNKGAAGLLLEGKLGIPTSSACLDCIDGEIKAFPQTKATSRSSLAKKFGLKEGHYLASETVAITMMKPSDLLTTKFEDSRICKKINNVLFISYVRDGDYVSFNEEKIFNNTNPLFHQIVEDYEAIKNHYETHGEIKSRVGELIQVRTKGLGNGAPKTYAFYFRRQFLIQLFQ